MGDGADRPVATATEQAVASAFGDALGVVGVGAQSDFFGLGGHSLLVVRVAESLSRSVGCVVGVRDVFEAPTVGALAARIDERLAEGAQLYATGDGIDVDETALPELGRASDSEFAPLSAAQERLWFLHRLDPDSPAYTISAALRLRGPLDRAALADALAAVVARHPALRSRIVETAEGPRQVADCKVLLDLVPIPVDGSSRTDREREARRRAAEMVAAPFDLRDGPPLRVRVLGLGPDDHVLVVGLHHAFGDGASVGVLKTDLLRAYRRAASGKTIALAPAASMAEVARWERHATGDLDESTAYWEGALSEVVRDDTFRLPTDHARPVSWSGAGQTIGARVGADVADAIRRLARDEQTTPFAVVAAVFALALRRIAAHDRPVFGTPVGGRTRAGTERTVGCLVNTVVLRLDVSGVATVRHAVRVAGRSVAGAMAHQDVPFDRVVEALRPDRDGGRHPLFQVMLSYEGAERDRSADAGGPLGAEEFSLPDGVAKVDLTLVVTETGAGFDLALEYATDLFEGETAERWLAHVRALMVEAARAPDTFVDRLALPADEAARIVQAEGDDTLPATQTVLDGIGTQVTATPDAVAAVGPRGHLSYAALWDWADRRASALRKAGVETGDVVALEAAGCGARVAALLGTWRAGAVALPLDAGQPVAARDAARADAGAKVTLSDTPGGGEASLSDDESSPSPAQTAYVIYTSGSTGTPKGVAVSHAAFASYAAAIARAYRLDRSDRALQFAPGGFDVALEEVVPTLLAGGTVVASGPGGVRADLGGLAEGLRRHGVTVANLPGAFFHAWTAHIVDRPAPPSLRALVAGSEAVQADRLAEWQRQRPGVALWNAYGLTETTVTSVLWEAHDDAAGDAVAAVGSPLPGATVRVLDRVGRRAPLGTTGEVYVGGAMLADGYLGQPATTAERFRPDPFARHPGRRLYRTGDLGRWDADGRLHIEGRRDRQVKIRGHRIELSGVEAAIRALPGIADAAVAVRDDRLAAFVVPVSSPADAETFRAGLREAVSAFPTSHRPDRWALLDALPRTASGKVDPAALPEAPAERRPDYVAPSGATEERVSGLWAEMLGVDRVGATDDFFALGGHSLLAMRLAARMSEAFGVDLPVRALFEAPTVRGAAAALAAADPPTGPIARITPSPDLFTGPIDDLADADVDRLLLDLTRPS